MLKNGEVKDGKLFYRGIKVFSLKAPERFRVNILKVEGDELVLEGKSILAQLGERCKIFVRDNEGHVWPLKLSPDVHSIRRSFTGEIIKQLYSYHVELPLKDHRKFSFWAQIGNDKVKLKISFKRYGKLNEKLPHTYYAGDKYLVKYEGGTIYCINRTWKSHIMAELRYVKDLYHEKKGGLILYRLVYFLKKRCKKHPIWLLYDRTFKAGDNGEALFRYIEKEMNGDEKVYFSIYKESEDFTRLRKLGKVIPFNTFRYKIYFLLADKLISSHIDEQTINVFGQDVLYMKNLYDFEFIFLQHGIIQNDLSDWLQKQKKNIRLFVTSAKPEWESIVNGDYGYTQREVKLLGMPRYDLLESDPQKIIVFLPTWRKTLTGEEIKPGIKAYSETFKETEYFAFFNSMINDSRLLQVMEEKKYQGIFYVHPELKAQYKDFKGNSIVSIGRGVADYTAIFKKACLLITDYSSVAFDFAYLKKPVIYSQFDTDEFYYRHTNRKGYFSYERDAFGPVCYEYDWVIEQIIKQINIGCKMEDIYRQRVEQFFAYTDRNNCERVYREIKKL